jgi:hypothetical protein
MKNPFTEHPHDVGESYCTHFKFAAYMGINQLMASLAWIIHAIFPFLFMKTGSSISIRMMRIFIERRPNIEGDAADLLSVMERKKVQPQKI